MINKIYKNKTTTPKLLVLHKNMYGQIEGIDYVDILYLPYDFIRLAELLKNNMKEFKYLTTNIEFCKNFNETQVRKMQEVIGLVEKLNAEYINQPQFIKKEK